MNSNARFIGLFIVGVGVATIFLALVALFSPAFGDWEDCVDATCRVRVGNGVGTGCCYARDVDNYYIVTCKHVVGNKKINVKCEFWYKGRLQNPVIGIVQPNTSKYDVVSIKIPKAAFRGYVPVVIPLAPLGYIPKPLDEVVSVGCARGAWPTLWRGYVVSYDNKSGDFGFRFEPRPAGGRSGSAVFDAKGEYIIALITARNNDVGLAVTLPAIHESLAPTTKPPAEKPSCPNGRCPTCSNGQCPMRNILRGE